MIIIKAKEGLEDLYNLAKQSLACVEKEAQEEYEIAVREIKERIDAKYADKRATLTHVVDSLSDAYEEEDPEVEDPEVEEPVAEELPTEESEAELEPQLITLDTDNEIKPIPEDLLSL